MKSAFPIIGLFAVLLFVAMQEGNAGTIHGGVPIYEEESNAEVDVFQQAEQVPASLEYQLEEIREKDGYTIEVYREYEIYRDENGTIVKMIPTDHYNYLRYEK